MKKLALIALIAGGIAASATLVLPTIGTAADPAFAPKDCTKPKIEPGRIVVTCADGNFFVKIRDWKYFNGREAKAKAVAHINSCRPDCASGTFKTYNTRIYLDDTERIKCGKGKVKMFTEITVRYLNGHPKGTGTSEVYPLDCIS